MGGLGAGIDLWELAYLPSLLNNCETWVSTPMPALCWDMGGYRIMHKKLVFLNHLKNLDKSTLARQVFDVQVQHRMDGLVQECQTLCVELKLPKII